MSLLLIIRMIDLFFPSLIFSVFALIFLSLSPLHQSFGLKTTNIKYLQGFFIGIIVFLLIIPFYLAVGNEVKGCILMPDTQERVHQPCLVVDYSHVLYSDEKGAQLFYNEPLYDYCRGFVTSLVLEGKITKKGKKIKALDLDINSGR